MNTAEAAMRKPLPSPDGDTAALWAGMREGRLLLQHCRACGHVAYYQQQICRRCSSAELEARPASGDGTVHSFSVVHRAPGPAFNDEVPYAVLLVELAEGPRMISTYAGDPAEVDFDMKLRITFDPVSEEITLPRFRKA